MVAAVATALETPVLAIAAGPREAEALAADLESYLGGDAVALLPSWEALPYEGLSPAPDVAARRAEAVRRLRAASGAFVVVAPAMAAMQRLIPTLGTETPTQLVTGLELAARRARRAARRPRVPARRRGRTPRRVRGAGRRRRRLPGHGATPGPARVLGRRDRVDARVRPLDPALVVAGRLRTSCRRSRELIPDDAVRVRAAGLAPAMTDRVRDGLQRIADGLHAEGAESFAPFLFDEMPTPADLLPAGAWVVVVEAERTLDRARQTRDEAVALAEALGVARARRDAGARRRALRPRAAASHRVHAGRGPGARALGDRAGERAGACDPPREPARARLPVDRVRPAGTGRSRGSAR